MVRRASFCLVAFLRRVFRALWVSRASVWKYGGLDC